MPRDKAIYVIVRKDLPKSQQAVQGGHALAQLLLDNQTTWNNGTLVYLGVSNIKILEDIYKNLFLQKEVVSKFEEPDLLNELTAIAVLSESLLSKFPELKLM